MTNVVQSHSLFEIDNELDDLLEQIESGSRLRANLRRAAVTLSGVLRRARREVDRIGRFVRMMEARVQFCRTEATRLGERARATANKVDRNKSMVLFYLMSRELRKIEGPRVHPSNSEEQ